MGLLVWDCVQGLLHCTTEEEMIHSLEGEECQGMGESLLASHREKREVFPKHEKTRLIQDLGGFPYVNLLRLDTYTCTKLQLRN